MVVPCPSATLDVGSSSSSSDKPSEKVGKDLSRNADSLRAPDPSSVMCSDPRVYPSAILLIPRPPDPSSPVPSSASSFSTNALASLNIELRNRSMCLCKLAPYHLSAIFLFVGSLDAPIAF